MMTVSRRRALAVIAGGAGLAALPGSAFANDSLPRVDVILQQNPGGLTVTGVTGRDGAVRLTPPAPGTYNVFLPRPGQITRACVLVIQQPGIEVVTSDPFGPAPARTSDLGYIVSKGGKPMRIVTRLTVDPSERIMAPVRLKLDPY